MAQRANLIATYNANPTLQKQYTLDQYLALFDFGQTPTTPTPTPTPTPEVPGIPNIINQNINQGGGGNGGDGPPSGPSYSRDDDLGTSDYQGTGPGFFEGLMSIPGALVNAYQQFSPLGFIGRKIEANKVAKQKALDTAFEKQKAERAAQEAIRAEAERAAQYGATNYGQGAGGQSYSNMGTQGFGVAAGGMGGPVSNKTGSGRQDYDDGGKVKMADMGDPNENAEYHSQRLFGKSYKELTADELEEFQEEMRRLMSKFMADGGRVYLYHRLK